MQEKPGRGLFAKGFFEKLLYFLQIDIATQDKGFSLIFFQFYSDHKNVFHTLKKRKIFKLVTVLYYFVSLSISQYDERKQRCLEN